MLHSDNGKIIILIQTIMLNHLYGWLRLPMTNLLDRNDIIRFFCSRSWQTNHILQLLFAINQMEFIGNYKNIINDVDKLQRKPPSINERLMILACSDDFRKAIDTGIILIKDLIYLADKYYPQIRAEAFFRTITNESIAAISLENKMRMAESIAESYKTMLGIESLILDGSLAIGMSDDASDIDLTAYCNFIPDIDLRKSRLNIIDDKNIILAESDRFAIDGVYIHVDYKTINEIENAFAVFPQSICKTLALWETIQQGKVFFDPRHRFHEWKIRLSKLPHTYKNRLISELSTLLIEEKRQLDIAIKNDDLIYCSMLIGNILTIYFQLLGVINNRFLYFPKWMNHAHQFMNHKPDDVYIRFIKILSQNFKYDNLVILSNELHNLIEELLIISQSIFLRNI